MDRVAAAILPADHFRSAAALRAIANQDGTVPPEALPYDIFPHDEQDNALTPSTSSTSIWEDAEISNGITLPDFGVWLVVIDGGCLVRNSGGNSSDFRLLFNGNQVASISKTAVATGGTYFRKLARISGVVGGTAIDARIQVKTTSSGTTSASDGIITWRAYRG